jgi:hypothetical protein
MFGRAERFSRLLGRRGSEGGATVACAAALPLVVLALAVAADYANVSHFRSRVPIARQADSTNDGGDLAGQVAEFVFIDHAPRGAGTPTVDVKSHATAVTATVGYVGVAPSNFGSAFGYDAVSVDASSTSLARVADFRPAVAR